ncbi:hypothetical protein A9Q84_19205 [Halobacteriovorax marinus]|uniref:Glycosyltransferase RgtA/B/C/D-like domain-containing protein n=1 Tax=Halobacteriovorax marinus TaxID=97084 RepID=A0A1Y5F876_9BACT|nr:hypothetical protein A9Q84_19205 [Halobacteriovorax marinus]
MDWHKVTTIIARNDKDMKILSSFKNSPLTRYFFFFFLFLAISLFALRFDPEMKPLESGVYSNYLTSMVEDGDLNIINQIHPKERWIATKSYNHPTMHDHGVTTLWLPFYLYSKILKSLSIDLNYYKLAGYRATMVFANTFFFILLAIFTFKIIPYFFNTKLSRYDFLLVLFGTPLFWYGFISPSTADISSAFYPFLCLIMHRICLSEDKKINYFIYGLILALGAITKVPLLFYFILPFHFLLVNKSRASYVIKNLAPYFIAGSLYGFIPFFINEWVKYGEFTYSYAGIISSYNLLLELTFGPAGYFYVSPIYLLVIPSLFAIVKRKQVTDKSVLFFLILAPIIKILAESSTYAGNADFGGRHLITDLLILLLLFPTFYVSRSRKIVIRIIATVMVFQSLFMAFVFTRDLAASSFVWGINYETTLDALSSQLPKMSYFLSNVLAGFSLINLGEILKYIPLMAISALILTFLSRIDFKNQEKMKSYILKFSLYISSLYFLITITNVFNNPKNVQKLKDENFFAKIAIVNGPEAYFFEDNVGNLILHGRFSKERGDLDMERETKILLKEYLEKAKSQILIDPINLKDQLEIENINFPDPFNKIN